MKLCKTCQQNLDVLMFSKDSYTKDGYRYDCKSCNAKRVRRYYINNPPDKVKLKERNKMYRDGYKFAVFSHYSNQDLKCACCKEREFKFLAVDHINGGGNKHREAIGVGSGGTFYRWLINNNFPSGYQILCHNCNMAKAFYGQCPHTPEQIAKADRK